MLDIREWLERGEMLRLVDRSRAWAVVAIAMAMSACVPQTGTPAAGEPPAARAAAASTRAERTAAVQTVRNTAPDDRPHFVPGELIVKFKAGTPKSRADTTLRSAAVRFARGYRTVPGLMRISLSQDASLQTTRARLERDPDVEYVELNYIYYPHQIPNDTWFHTQSNLHFLGGGESPPDSDIDAPEAWDITTGSNDIVVAVLDTGYFAIHEDLAGNTFRNESECDADGVDDDANGYTDDCNGIDAFENDSDPTDITVHGTHVSGTIGAVSNNSKGIAGVAWHVKILPCRFIDFFNGGTLADAVECLDYVAAMKDRGVNIVATNNSWGNIYPSRALDDAIGAQLARGILTITSAGNDSLDNDREPKFPCNSDHANVICVGSSSFMHRLSGFSNYGDQTVHLTAPGEYVLSTTSANATLNLYDYLSGTSMATPAVTGTAVLLAAQDPSRDWRAIRNLLLAGVDPVAETQPRTISGGRLNAYGSLTCANRVVVERLRPEFRHHVVSAGMRIPLRAMHINCAFPNGSLSVAVAPTGESIALADDGSGDDEVAGDGIYNGHWTAPAAGGTYELTFASPIGDVVVVEVDPDLKPGFPLKGMDSGWFVGFWDGPGHEVIAGNIDADPELEVLIPSVSAGPLFAYNHDGSAIPGWPLVDYGGQPYTGLGEFDGDPQADEVATIRIGSYGAALYRGDGSAMPGWPHPGLTLNPPAIADLDGDGLDEVIMYPARRADGSVFNPVAEVPWFGSLEDGGGFPAAIAVADLDGDSRPDMAYARRNGLRASTAEGLIEGFPVSFPAEVAIDSSQINPVLGDVDADGRIEIILGTHVRGVDESFTGRVFVYSHRGEHLRTLIMPTLTNLWVTPVLADLTGDGVPEIIVQNTQHIYAWHGDGSPVPGWPVFLGQNADSVQSTPVIGDIDGDGLPDLVTTAGDTSAPWAGTIYRYHRDGRPHDGHPKPLLSFRLGMAAAIADIDLDGRNDLLVSPTSVPGVSDTLYGYDYNGGNPSGPIEWGQYMEGPENRGYYELGKNLPDHAFLVAYAHGAGRLESTGGGIACGSDCIEKVQKGSRLTLRAIPDDGGTFVQWLGACAGQGNPCVLTVDAFTSAAASFGTPVDVRFAGSGAGTVRSTPAGIECTQDCSAQFAAMTIVTLSATAGHGDGFDGWSGACSNFTGDCRLFLDDAKSVTANFTSERRLEVMLGGTGHGTVRSSPAGIVCGADCAGDFAPDATVTLTAAAEEGSALRRWGEGCEIEMPTTCTVRMDRARTILAVFELEPNVSVDTTGGGRVTSSPAGIDCGTDCDERFSFDSNVTLTATPDAGGSFTGWTGICSGTHTTCVLSFLQLSHHVSARFTGAPGLTISMEGGGSGSVTSNPSGIDCGNRCSASFAEDDVVVLTAVPDGGSRFHSWSGACVGTQPSCSFNLLGSSTVAARFERTGSPPPGGGGSGGGGGGAPGWLTLAALAWLARRKQVERRA